MSLFFLILTAVIFLISHWMARNSKPGTDYIYQKDFIFTGNKKTLTQNISSWVHNSSSLSLTHNEGNEFVIQKNASIFSYGYFYHIKISPIETDSLFQVKFKIEARLISAAKEQHFFSKTLLSQLDLEEEVQDEAA